MRAYINDEIENDISDITIHEELPPKVDTSFHKLTNKLLNSDYRPIILPESDLADPNDAYSLTWTGYLMKSVTFYLEKLLDHRNTEVIWSTVFQSYDILQNQPLGESDPSLATTSIVETLCKFYEKHNSAVLENGDFNVSELLKSSYNVLDFIISSLQLSWFIIFGFCLSPLEAFASFEQDDTEARRQLLNSEFKDFYLILAKVVTFTPDDSYPVEAKVGLDNIQTLAVGIIQFFHRTDEVIADFKDEHKSVTLKCMSLLDTYAVILSSKNRKVFDKQNSETTRSLERIFEEDRYPSQLKFEEMATELKKPVAEVKSWFSKRRTKPEAKTVVSFEDQMSIASSVKSEKQKLHTEFGDFNIITFEGHTKYCLILKYLTLESIIVENSPLFVRSNLYTTLTSLFQRSKDGLFSFFLLGLINELLEIPRFLNHFSTQYFISEALKIPPPSISTSNVIMYLNVLIDKCPSQITKLKTSPDGVLLLKKSMKYILWALEQGYDEASLTASRCVIHFIESDQLLFKEFVGQNGLSKILKGITNISSVQTHVFSHFSDTDTAQRVEPKKDSKISKYEIVMGTCRLENSLLVLHRYLFLETYKFFIDNIEHDSKIVLPPRQHEEMAPLLPVLIQNGYLQQWSLIDKLLEANLLPIVLKMIYDGCRLAESRSIKTWEFGTKNALNTLLIMVLTDACRLELTKTVTFSANDPNYRPYEINWEIPKSETVKSSGLVILIDSILGLKDVLTERTKRSHDTKLTLTHTMLFLLNTLCNVLMPPFDDDKIFEKSTLKSNFLSRSTGIRLTLGDKNLITGGDCYRYSPADPLPSKMNHDMVNIAVLYYARYNDVILMLKNFMSKGVVWGHLLKLDRSATGSSGISTLILILCQITESFVVWPPTQQILKILDFVKILQNLKSEFSRYFKTDMLTLKTTAVTHRTHFFAQNDVDDRDFTSVIDALISKINGFETKPVFQSLDLKNQKIISESNICYNKKHAMLLLAEHFKNNGFEDTASMLGGGCVPLLKVFHAWSPILS